MVRNDIRGSLGSSKQFLMLGRVLFSLRTSFLCVKLPCGVGALLMQVRMPPEMRRNEPQEPLQSSVCAADSIVTVEIALPKVKLKV